jgi:hypothetical protein
MIRVLLISLSVSFLSNAGPAGAIETAPQPEGEEFQKILVTHVWSWEPDGKQDGTVRFEADGSAKHSRVWSARWKLVGPRDVLLSDAKNPKSTSSLHFDEAGERYEGIGFSKRAIIRGSRKERLDVPLSIAGSSPQVATAAPVPSPKPTPRADGILLAAGWDTPLQGGRDTLEDLERILSPLVEPSNDNKAAPSLKIYEEVTYLMPLDKATALLGVTKAAASKNNIACPGFPKRLVSSSYDGLWLGHYKRLYIVTDHNDRVVSLQFVDESPARLAYYQNTGVKTYNFVNTRKKASGTVTVRYTTTQAKETINVQTGLYGSEKGKMLEDVSWYVPKPFAALIRYCAQRGLQ